MELIIDRFEGEYAVLEAEDQTCYNVPRAILPDGAHEGDLIIISIGDNSERKEKIKRLMDDLFE